MSDLNTVIDVMLPGDPGLGMPSASQIGFEAYLAQYRLGSMAQDFLQMLEGVCIEKYSMSLGQLSAAQCLQAIQACRLKDIRLFTAMVEHLFKAYYTAPEVLRLIGAGSVPPFPQGNALAQDDWTLLEPVYLRGPIYRECGVKLSESETP
jgi:hypothetical protein